LCPGKSDKDGKRRRGRASQNLDSSEETSEKVCPSRTKTVKGEEEEPARISTQAKIQVKRFVLQKNENDEHLEALVTPVETR
jgi:hypothetical protein